MNDTERIQQQLVKADPSDELVSIFHNLGYGSNMAIAYEAGRDHERSRAENAEQRCMQAERGWRDAEATIKAKDEHAAQQAETIRTLRAEVEEATASVKRMKAPVTDEDVFAFSLDTLDPQESIPIFIAYRANPSQQPHNGTQEASE